MAQSSQQADPLMQGFVAPPNAARPRVWWHWMNGNITQEGIAADLAWMDEVGIGGFQNFDADLGTPQIVENRLAYMTPEWREAFRFAASEADRYGLEMAIAASPGWSETGGPWVPAEDGVKKIVWGQTLLTGGTAFHGAINRAPTNTGPYQAMPVPEPEIALSDSHPPELPDASGHIAVLAVPVSEPTLPTPQFSLADGTAVSPAAMVDADLESGHALPLAADKSGALYVTYPQPVIVRSLDLAIPGLVRPFRSPPVLPLLEVRTADGWQQVGDIPLINTPMTLGFEPVTGSEFRLRIIENPNIVPPTEMDGVEGAVALDVFALGDLSTVSVNQFAFGAGHRMNRVQEKAGFAGVMDYYAIMSDDETPVELALGDVIDISDRVAADGTLDWTPPAGSDWLVLDFGWSLIGTTNHPAPPEATGLEVDKYDPHAVRRYLETYLGMYREATGDDLIGERGLRAILTDSIETGFANWTPAMEREFEERRGYALRPWLPALTGLVIGSEAETEAFLYDWRDTLAELLTDNHYGTVADVAHENGLIVYGEALEDKRPMLGDDLSMRRHADIPMAALWTYPSHGSVRTTLIGDMRGAASTAHVYGQNLVAAESMTAANSPWAFSPRDLRRFIDLEFAHGINRPVIHTSVHQPLDDFQPGVTLAIFGQYFNRHETWAGMARPWVDYMSRNAYMLQQGHFFADVAWFRGEEAPVTAQYAAAVPDGLPQEYAFDFVNADMLADAMHVEDGMLVTQGGTRYRALVLGPDARNMTLPTLRRIADLVGQGATVIGERPAATPSLADDKEEFARLADQLWTGPNVHGTADYSAVLHELGVAPDFAFTGGGSDAEILFLHRQMADGSHSYFLNNRRNRAEQVEARFRVTGYAPELWDAVTGEARPLSYRFDGDHTVVPVAMGPEESFFVVFREATSAQSRTVPQASAQAVATIDGPWQVVFQEGRGAPAGIAMDELSPLNEHADDGVRYFSGVASYTTTFTVEDADEGLWVDLGQVADVAEVYINGTYAGTSWWAPDRVAIGEFLQPGENRLEVRVANRWINRLIGDAQPGAEPLTQATAPTYMPDAPLRPAGLIGPVRLLSTP
ncbi:glycosyl hydrolase [Aurantiacibacter gilvus]|uniref:Glycosyl hydrolase n=1 Tax=Aurantiacibacter gilvus TaxID=3139141 RepID=A0ABU9IF78_9SPHN